MGAMGQLCRSHGRGGETGTKAAGFSPMARGCFLVAKGTANLLLPGRARSAGSGGGWLRGLALGRLLRGYDDGHRVAQLHDVIH